MTSYEAGVLTQLTSPSLFGQPRFITVAALDKAGTELIDDLLRYIPRPEPDVTLVLRHNGGARAKKVIECVRSEGGNVYRADEVKRVSEKWDFIRAEVAGVQRTIDDDAVRALVDALGSDLAELAAVTRQLLNDVDGTITIDDVNRYQAGRIETTGFAIADHAVAGDVGKSLALLRHAIESGLSPVAIVGAIASKVRQLVKVRVPGYPDASELKMQQWMIERAQRETRAWSDAGLARAIEAIARADAEVKGESKSPIYAVERLLAELARARAMRH